MLLKDQEVAMNQLDDRASSSSGAPPPSYNPSSSALVFDVTRSGGLTSNDVLVSPVAGTGQVYFLSFPRAFNYKWDITVHRDGSARGPLLGTLTKQSGIGRHDIEVEMGETGFKTMLARSGKWLSKSHEFAGQKGGKYEWRGGLMSSSLTCYDLSNARVAASWERSRKIGKDGELSIERAYEHEQDLLVLTGLAMEKLRQEQRKKAATASAIGGGASA